MALTFAALLDAVPLVPTTAYRNAFYGSTTPLNQRVQNLETGNIERWTGTTWVIDFTGSAELPAALNWVSVVTYGALGDGTTDDTAAIQAAADACALTAAAATPVLLYFPPCAGGYKTTAGITVGPYISVIMDGPILYTGSTTAVVALSIGTPNVANQYGQFRIRVRQQTQSDWTDTGNVGVRFVCLNSCADCALPDVQGFTIGAQFVGDTAGAAYNQIRVGILLNNAWGLDLTTNNGGFCNENDIWGGRFAVNSGVNTTTERVGVHIGAQDAVANPSAYLTNNNNRFWGPSFELNASDAPTVDSVGLWVEYGQRNWVQLARNENTSIALRAGSANVGPTNAASNNIVTLGYVGTVSGTTGLTNYGFSQIQQWTAGTGDNLVWVGNNAPQLGAMRSLWQLPSTVLAASAYDPGASKVTIRGAGIAVSSSTTIAREQTALTINANDVTLGANRGIGVLVGTTQNKRFLLSFALTPGVTAGRTLVRCFDSGGTPLDNTGPNTPYVRGAGGVTFIYSAAAAGWLSGADNILPSFFQVGADVATMWVGVWRGTADVPVQSIGLWTLDPFPSTITPGYTTEPVVPALLAVAPPTAGTYLKGQVLYHGAPSVGSPLGWMCTTAGTPGTWTPVGAPLFGAQSADRGDTAQTLTWGTDFPRQTWATPLTTPRAVTLSTTGAVDGAAFAIVRTAAATGASALNVGTGPLAALAVGEWCVVGYDGAAWGLLQRGILAQAAPLASPAFTGTPSLPTGTTGITQTAADNSTKLATTAYVDRTPGSGSFTSAAPAGTTSATAVMMAAGAATITPTKTGRVLMVASGQMANSTLNDGATVDLRSGTGTAPVNGAAVTGTLRGIAQTATSLVAAQRSGFCLSAVVSGLTLGTAVWVDVSLLAVTAGTATVTGVSIALSEI